MNRQIDSLRRLQWERAHHAARKPVPAGVEAAYRRPELTDYERTALRLETALKLETPWFMEGEIFAFTRTVPALPMIFSQAEWDEIRAHHFIHELGNVSNLSPDYASVLANGLQAYLDRLGDGRYHAAMWRSIEALAARSDGALRSRRAQRGIFRNRQYARPRPALWRAHAARGAAEPARAALRDVVRGRLSQHARPVRPVHGALPAD